ncbi:hypothetical protein [Furfurilactobacillus milii]|uniref:Uncharacterized protein n=1 Tax=Furfurilactobacillus milii TaxID=2888272 RepID=A0A6N9I0A6_9LACO|nr:hypothetical protein [Furfurilactobacillus milii]MYV16177.1 hypothetical protein [Furfurilactobacillus milii]
MEKTDCKMYAWGNIFKLTVENQDKVLPISVNVYPKVNPETGEITFFVDPEQFAKMAQHGLH